MTQREIKFRAWTGLEMEYRVVAGQLGAFYVQGLDPKDTASMSPFNTKYSEQTPIMQYTGLDDKNGKEIYEGDIVKRYGKLKPTRRRYGTAEGEGFWVQKKAVQFLSGKKRNGWNVCAGMYEVIGNIYENPGLLK